MFRLGISEIHGRGVFATQALDPGKLIETSHLLACKCGEGKALLSTHIGNYAFYIEDCFEHPGEERLGIALSEMSFLNHSHEPNLVFEVNVAELLVAFIVKRTIAAGEELTIDYGEVSRRFSA